MTVSVDAVESAPGPRWTHKRFITMLGDCYGTGPRGGVNTAAVADYAGVYRSTVSRWIAPGETRYQLGVPAPRINQLQLAPPMVELRAAQQYRHALQAIADIDSGSGGLLEVWEGQGWLKPHRVAVVDLAGKPWLQVVVNRAATARRKPPHRSESTIQLSSSGSGIGQLRAWDDLHRDDNPVTQVVVPHWFYAQILVRAVMVRQWNWRVHPSRHKLAVGRTRVWMPEAPAVQLRSLARQSGVPVTHSV